MKPSTTRTLTAWSVLILLMLTVLPALAAASVDQQLENLNATMTRVKGLTLSALKQIKALDQKYRTGGGYVMADMAPAAQQEMARIELIINALEDQVATAKAIESELRKTESSLSDDNQQTIETHKKQRQRYSKAVSKYWKKAIRDFGPPQRAVPGQIAVPAQETFSFVGEASATLGQSKYKRPNVNPVFESSKSDFGFSGAGTYAVAEKTRLDANLAYKSTVERQEIGTTNFGASVTQLFSENFRGTAGFDRFSYAEKDNDIANFSETGMFAKAAYRDDTKALNATLRRVGRGYKEENVQTPAGPVNADFSRTSILLNGSLVAGDGLVRGKLNRISNGYSDNDALDHNDLTIGGVWEIQTGGTEVGAELQTINHPNLTAAQAALLAQAGVSSSPYDTKRYKAHLLMKKRDGMTQVEWGPSIAHYTFPDLDDQDFTDIKLQYGKRRAGDGYSTSRINLVYRRYQDTLQYDFAQLSWRRMGRPGGSGRYGDFNVAGRFYIEAPDKDNPFRFQNPRPAHSFDVYWRFGVIKAGRQWLRKISFGPIIGHKMYIDTEADDAFGDANDVDYILQNPRNSATVGFDTRATMLAGKGVRVDGEFKFEHAFFYNSDPKRSTNLFSLRLRATYPINEQFDLRGTGDFHRTRADVDAASDLDRNGVVFQLIYKFDVRK